MTLRIDEAAGEHEVVLALHGWLTAAEVPEVERLSETSGRVLRIDLGQLTGADEEGLRTLRRLRENGAQLSKASPYLKLLLGLEGDV